MIEPFYFGTNQELLALYHPPVIDIKEQIGIILCYPMGQEYLRCHRSFLSLAEQCSLRGYHALRFDYYGCGDSYGEHTQSTLARWIEDISCAVRELDDNGIKDIYLVGLRLGASLATLCSVQHHNIKGLVLWNPILNGAAYRNSLQTDYQRWLEGTFISRSHHLQESTYREIAGFLVTETLWKELNHLDLLNISNMPTEHVLLIDTEPLPQYHGLCSHLKAMNVNLTFKHLPSLRIWEKTSGHSSFQPVPITTLQTIVNWISLSCQ